MIDVYDLLNKARSRMEDVVNGMESRDHLQEVIDEIEKIEEDPLLNIKVILEMEEGIPGLMYSNIPDVPIEYLILDYDSSDGDEKLPVDSNGKEWYVYQDKTESAPKYVEDNFELLYTK